MTYEQKLRRLYELLVAADDQSRLVLNAAPYPEEQMDVSNIAAHVNHTLWLIRNAIKTTGAGKDAENGAR